MASSQLITATAVKETPDVLAGIGLVCRNGEIFITSLTEYGIFASSPLQVGDKIVAINNHECINLESANEAIGMIKSAVGTLTIVAERRAAPSFVAHPVAQAAPSFVAQPTAQAVPVTVTGSMSAPGRAPPGGVWGINRYIGEKTQMAACVGCLCFCLPGLFILCCPCDERDAYKVNGQIYDAEGVCIGSAAEKKFVPSRSTMER